MAFVNSNFGGVFLSPSNARTCATARPRHTNGRISPRASLVEENKRAKVTSEENGPQGFTGYSELVNGRLAMIGFVL
eukprot:CAMPEP_0184677872 /NCGR_PEP_ID=MMETSP0312-20130426/495_1 /TAXON_ID=31354 /ORGANISM="Compsopogon coeruleus, Strain SAG 36.94" /LENGTH=76 /DNA_ID=CAMNT_0027126069 /DNA_START=72 /DNA_END=298 /DNA_ORIENTATION=-